METIRLETVGPVAALIMARGKANALNHAMIREMNTAVDTATADPAVKALVIASDRPRFFSAGFDVTEVFRYGRDEIGAFLTGFGALMDAVQWCQKPVVAALNGQTYAGGALLALCADFRIMADSPAYGFALTEVNIGVRLPGAVYHLLAGAAGAPLARRMFLTGDPARPQEGLAAGLFHQVCPEDQVLAAAVDLARGLAEKPPETYAAIKHRILRANGLERRDPAAPWIDVDAWFTPEAEEMKRRMAEKLAAKG
jgi:enoyl-CoA hydratase/carnithine racemase